VACVGSGGGGCFEWHERLSSWTRSGLSCDATGSAQGRFGGTHVFLAGDSLID